MLTKILGTFRVHFDVKIRPVIKYSTLIRYETRNGYMSQRMRYRRNTEFSPKGWREQITWHGWLVKK